MRNLLLTGTPGVGKTTIVQKVAAQLHDRSGVITRELRRRGQRVGFRIEDLEGEGETMAHVEISAARRVGRYGVDLDAIERMVDRMLLMPETAVVLIDEIGKMECFSPKFVEAVTALLEGSRTVVATVGLRGGGFIAQVKERHDVELWTVTAARRDEMPRQIIEWIRQVR